MKQQFTLLDGEQTPDTITMEGEHVSDWNGMPVPRVTARAVVDYWAACRANDPNGEWYAAPFVDAEGCLRIPSFNDPDDRDEDYVYAPNADDMFDVDGLVWSLVEGEAAEASEQDSRTFTMGLPVDVTINHDGRVHLTVYPADLIGNLEDNCATAADVALAGRALAAGTLTTSVSAR